ncbi:MAG TPA: 50S ribosomal protein L11 methyltransferase, partial [Acidimicrobiales bacterium]|nr:50S ribosomal protein L11 methyltransferase [Acidimicrobiales bacterium]
RPTPPDAPLPPTPPGAPGPAQRAPDLVAELSELAADAELAADRCWQNGATAVGFRDEPDGTVTVVASFPTPAAARQVAGRLDARLVEVDPGWRDVWKDYAEPIPVGERLLVAPAWRDVPVGDGRLVLTIDPGGCFGSGSHPSTRLILAALDADPPAGLDVLDVGCGSGVLAIAAARLGAGRVVAVDIDPEAVAATRSNAGANGVAGQVEASVTPVGSLTGRFDLALVNVTAGVHAELAAAVTARVKPGGRLLLAGLLPGQWAHIAGSYDAADIVELVDLEGWEGVVLNRK